MWRPAKADQECAASAQASSSVAFELLLNIFIYSFRSGEGFLMSAAARSAPVLANLNT